MGVLCVTRTVCFDLKRMHKNCGSVVLATSRFAATVLGQEKKGDPYGCPYGCTVCFRSKANAQEFGSFIRWQGPMEVVRSFLVSDSGTQ